MKLEKCKWLFINKLQDKHLPIFKHRFDSIKSKKIKNNVVILARKTPSDILKLLIIK